MKTLSAITFILSLAAAAYFFHALSELLSWIFSAAFAGFGFTVLIARRTKSQPIVKLKGLSWSREDFCRGWLITGDTALVQVGTRSITQSAGYRHTDKIGKLARNLT